MERSDLPKNKTMSELSKEGLERIKEDKEGQERLKGILDSVLKLGGNFDSSGMFSNTPCEERNPYGGRKRGGKKKGF